MLVDEFVDRALIGGLHFFKLQPHSHASIAPRPTSSSRACFNRSAPLTESANPFALAPFVVVEVEWKDRAGQRWS